MSVQLNNESARRSKKQNPLQKEKSSRSRSCCSYPTHFVCLRCAARLPLQPPSTAVWLSTSALCEPVRAGYRAREVNAGHASRRRHSRVYGVGGRSLVVDGAVRG